MTKKEQKKIRDAFTKIIAEEILICFQENKPTSRLTSLATKFYKFLDKEYEQK